MLRTKHTSALSIFLLIGKLMAFINPTPISQLYTEKSWYPERTIATSFAGLRQRISTCGGAAWFHGNQYLATVNFEGGFIATYAFNNEKKQFTPFQVLYGTPQAPLMSAENLSFSPDGKVLAVGVNHAGNINIYNLNTTTHLIDSEPAATIKYPDPCVHGTRFSPKTGYLACTAVRGASIITVYKLQTVNKKIEVSIASKLRNNYFPLKPKSLDFTKDEKYVVIVYSANVIAQPNQTDALVVCYKFNNTTGAIDPSPVSVCKNIHDFQGGEDIRLSKNDTWIVISDQAGDKIIGYAFDKFTGSIGKKIFTLSSPDAKLSFPHGIDLSSDGKYLVVANYGSDSVTLYSITEAMHP